MEFEKYHYNVISAPQHCYQAGLFTEMGMAFQALTEAPYSVDTFFFIGATLVSYLLLKVMMLMSMMMMLMMMAMMMMMVVMVMTYSIYSVDTFFFIGATLVSYLLLKVMIPMSMKMTSIMISSQDLDKTNGWLNKKGFVHMVFFYFNRS